MSTARDFSDVCFKDDNQDLLCKPRKPAHCCSKIVRKDVLKMDRTPIFLYVHGKFLCVAWLSFDQIKLWNRVKTTEDSRLFWILSAFE